MLGDDAGGMLWWMLALHARLQLTRAWASGRVTGFLAFCVCSRVGVAMRQATMREAADGVAAAIFWHMRRLLYQSAVPSDR